MHEQEVIEKLFEKGVLVHQDFLDKLVQEPLLDRLGVEADILVLNSDYAQVLSQSSSLVDWYELDKFRVEAEKERDDDLYQHHLREFQTSSLHLISQSEPRELSNLEVELQTDSTATFLTEHASLQAASLQDTSLQELSPHSALNPAHEDAALNKIKF